jgi:hypothetical protein
MEEMRGVGHVLGVHPSHRIDRKRFLTWSLSATSALALGCGAEAVEDGGPGTAGSAGTFSASGTAGSAGSAGTFSSSGSGGTGGTGGASGAGGGSGGAGGGAPVAPDCGAKLAVFITADHGHELAVSVADVMAGVAKSYDTKGTSNHPHWLELTAADFAKLQAGQMVRKLSCNDGHEHEFIINCTAVAKPETSSGITGQCDAEHACGSSPQQICPQLM